MVLILVACQEPSEVKLPGAISNEIETKSFKYLALGDSYTIGTAIGETNAYPYLLKDSLESNDTINQVEIQVIATNGWTTADLKSGIDLDQPDYDFDMVSLLIGVNNQYQGKDKAQYRIEFIELLLQSISFAKGNKERVFVLSIPDWGATPAAAPSSKPQIAADIDDFNTINKTVSDSLGVQYLDITAVSRTALSKPELVAKDGLHFSSVMHQLWLDAIYQSIKKQLLDTP